MAEKKISAAEQARREAQSAQDTGTAVETVVDINGVELSVSKAVLDDFEFQDAMLTASDDEATGEDKARALMVAFKRLAGQKRKDVLNALRDEHGRVPIEVIGETTKKIVEAANPNS